MTAAVAPPPLVAIDIRTCRSCNAPFPTVQQPRRRPRAYCHRCLTLLTFVALAGPALWPHLAAAFRSRR